jgi:energy-coupling factor transporter ATP-binding protein EcfA2
MNTQIERTTPSPESCLLNVQVQPQQDDKRNSASSELARPTNSTTKAKGLTEEEFNRLLKGSIEPKCLKELQDKFRITKDDVKDIKNMKFLYQQTFPEGHLIAIVGEPGCGKTTIMEYVCTQIQSDITYINDDIPRSAMPEAKRRADIGNYALVIPDQRIGESIESFMEKLFEFSELGEDLTGKVFIIDTLKKITKVNNKGDAADTYKKLRLLTSRGATVICLGHCLKYRDDEGFPVYEGTADLQADFDELVLLHASTGDYGLVTTSLYWREQGWGRGKARAIVQPLSWTIDTENNRKVAELTEWVDTLELGKENRQTLKSADVISDIYKLLDGTGEMKKGDIVAALKSEHGVRILNRILDTQTGKFWSVQTGNHNAKLFKVISNAVLPAPTV